MLAVILAVLVALSSTLMMLITMGQQQEETPVRQEETRIQQEANLQDDNQLIASTDAKGRAHFGLGILNPIEHRIIIPLTNNKDGKANATFATTAIANSITNNKANATFATTATANSIITNSNDNNDNSANANGNANNRDTGRMEEIKRNDKVTVNAKPNSFVNSKNNPTTIASCGQVITKDVILLKDIECPGVGMIVGTDGITINLNNHRLSLANNTDISNIPKVEEIGILVPGRKNITISGPGVIAGFDKAIEFAGGERGYILDLKLIDNNIGLSLKASDKITIYRSFIEGNTIGIASQSSKDALIVSNYVSQNTNEGIVLMDSNNFIIGTNTLIENGNIGMFLDVSSFNNTISSNNILNHAVDVSNADGIPIHISMNEYLQNSCGKALPDGIC
ncbi:MAG: right-handed parallel beta-helix repeat-containing protein [Thermoproteota archaeon]|nr:right-handed parallel beta-helix repeat-containing protein [Thermoproteota archaeon]